MRRVIAVDSNILVYAHRADSGFNDVASTCLLELARGGARWAIPWPCAHEFLAIVTHPKVNDPPSTLPQALDQVDAWLESPSVVMLGEQDGYWSVLRAQIVAGRVVGPGVHDARIAALCELHGVRELWTADRDFSRFPALRTHNPLAA